MAEERDEWRSWHQVLPSEVYDRLIVQLGRIGLSNGISAHDFIGDPKFQQHVGPRVQIIELLVLHLENLSAEELRNH